MWKLKFSAPFCGLFLPVIPAFAAAFVIPVLLHISGIWYVIASFLFLVLLLYGLYKLLHIPTKKDRAAMKQAKPLKWRKLSKQQKKLLRRYENPAKTVLVLAFLPATAAFLYMAGKDGWTPSLTWICCITEAGILLWALILHLDWKFWQGIGKDAEYAILPVHHTYTISRWIRTGKTDYPFLVCYLPDGKYIFEFYGNPPHCTPSFLPKQVYLIRYKGRVRWEFYLI